MKDIALPMLPHDTPLRTAIAVMHQADRSGIVTKVAGSVRLIRAGDVLQGLRERGSGTLADLGGVDLCMAAAAPQRTTRFGGLEWSVTETAAAAGVPMAPSSTIDMSHYDRVFQSTNYDYALARLGVGTAVVITRSEDFEADLQGGPLDCYCSGPRQHGYREPHPPICIRDGQPVTCW